MAGNESKQFHHLALPLIHRGRAKLHGGGQPSKQTEDNLKNRKGHSTFLKGKTAAFVDLWQKNIKLREEEDLPPLPKGVPLLLEIDPNADIDYLRSTFGFEIVSEHDDGFVIVASQDIDFKQFLEKIDGFADAAWGTGNTAKIHNLYADDSQVERLKRILSDDLFASWGDINNETEYIVDVGIECLGTIIMSTPVERKDNENENSFNRRLNTYMNKVDQAYIAWDELRMDRENSIEDFVYGYNGEILSYIDGENLGYSHLPDSFTARIKVKGKCVRDLAYNFPFLFEITQPEVLHEVKNSSQENDVQDIEFEITPPDDDNPYVCDRQWYPRRT